MNTKEIIREVKKKQRFQIFILYFFALLVVILRLSIGFFIYNYISQKAGWTAALTATAIAGATIVSFILDAWKSSVASSYGAAITYELSRRTFASALNADSKEMETLARVDFFDEAIRSCQKIGGDYHGHQLVMLISNLAYLMGAVILLFVLDSNYVLGLIVLLSLPVFYLIYQTFSRRARHAKERMAQKQKEGEARIVSDLHNIRTLKLRVATRAKEEAFASLMNSITKEEKLSERSLTIATNAMNSLFIGLLIAFGTFVGGIVLEGKSVSLGALVAFFYLVPSVYATMRSLISLNVSGAFTKEEAAFIDRVLVLRSEVRKDVPDLDLAAFSFQGVNSRCTKREEDVHDITFTVARGTSLGIYVPDGRGIGTLFELMTKLDRPKSGQIIVGTHDLARLDADAYRSRIAAIESVPDLLPGTIEENIIYPEERDDYRFNEAVKHADLRDFIYDQSDGAATIVGEAAPFTPEILKKIAFANAFYRDADMIILAEPFRELTAEDRTMILEEFLGLKNRLVIVISADPEVIKNCDQVAVLEGGAISRIGTPEVMNEKPKARRSRNKKTD